MVTRTKRSRRLLEDIRGGRHLEAYALFLTGTALVVLGVAGVVSETVTLSAILLALCFLIFHTTIHDGGRKPSLNQVLGGRADLGAFSQRLPGIHDLRIYGRRFVLHPGGNVRVLILGDSRRRGRWPLSSWMTSWTWSTICAVPSPSCGSLPMNADSGGAGSLSTRASAWSSLTPMTPTATSSSNRTGSRTTTSPTG